MNQNVSALPFCRPLRGPAQVDWAAARAAVQNVKSDEAETDTEVSLSIRISFDDCNGRTRTPRSPVDAN